MESERGSVGAAPQPRTDSFHDVIDLSTDAAAPVDSASWLSLGSDEVLELMDDGSWRRV